MAIVLLMMTRTEYVMTRTTVLERMTSVEYVTATVSLKEHVIVTDRGFYLLFFNVGFNNMDLRIAKT